MKTVLKFEEFVTEGVVKKEDIKKVQPVKPVKTEDAEKEVEVEEKPKPKGLTIKQKRHLPQALQDAILKAQGESVFHVKRFDEIVNEKVKNFDWMTKHYQVEYKKKGKDVELLSLLVDGEEIKDLSKIGSKLHDIIIDNIKGKGKS